VEEFKQRIYDTITETEVKENSMMHWLSTLSRHDFTGDRSGSVEKPAKRKQDTETTEKDSAEKKEPETCTDIRDTEPVNCCSEQQGTS
jgi:hypothetical protein